MSYQGFPFASFLLSDIQKKSDGPEYRKNDYDGKPYKCRKGTHFLFEQYNNAYHPKKEDS